ncbi:AMP-binding protein [Microbacterium esteraromaticum]|uniref:AMP-binding protein n=1 Tax=Microbacterium esteraromaticum TaxID=57043 RepID=UPI001C9371D7|nr:AMP-binding protein [Microbacterium esteraromaticum]MBY6060984.1 AMP-binding protein [Microbacterium esteraromaticum]
MSSQPPNSVPLTPLGFLERAARVFPDREAIVDGKRRYDYAEFAAEAQYAARALRARLAPGDRVATLSPNVAELLIAHYAVPLAGGVLVTVNTRLSVAEIAYILDHSSTRILLLEAELVDRGLAAVAATGRDILVVTIGCTAPAGAITYADLLVGGSAMAELAWTVADENAPITINYTSGTTGLPKGVVYSHRGAYLNSLGFGHHAGFDGNTRYLWTLPMFHCNGWCTTWAVTAATGRHIVLRAVRENAVWDAIDDNGVTHLCGAPTVLATVANSGRAHPVDVPLRMISGGAPASPTVIAQLERLGIGYTHAYGLTESYGPFTLCERQDVWDRLPADERAARMARQGVTMLQSHGLRVVNEAMDDVPRNGLAIGEIVIRGNNVMVGYHDDPEATAIAFAGGWFHTGDLAVMHPDGYIEIRDRAKDLIISGGENISSIEIENALLSHEAVSDAAVVAVPSDRWGERPIAYVALSAEVSEQELLRFLRVRLARFKVPDAIRFLDAVPRTSTGKALKRELRDLSTNAPGAEMSRHEG